MAKRPQRIILTGFSGTGKTLVAPLVAQRLKWRILDTDALVEEAAGRSILDIFHAEGEERFRELETEALARACERDDVVVSCGGGAILRAENRRLMADGGFIVALEARPETILRRLHDRGEEGSLDRPLLAVADPLARIRELKSARQHLYALADWTVQTDGLSPEETASEVIRAWQRMSDAILKAPDRVEEIASGKALAPATTLHAIPEGAACLVRAASGEYPVFVEWGALETLGERMRAAGLTDRAFLISDEEVYHLHGKQAEGAIARADIAVESFAVPPGEATKTLDTAARLYDWLIDQRAERGHAIVSLGGGMVTDLAGFVAATFARGLPLVHAPTSVLAMVDAAVGGKVAVNHPRSKNAIGAFYQPRLVLADPAMLARLPARERSGWAEALKHALILDAELMSFFESKAAAVLKLEPDATAEAIRRSVAVKAAVVSGDEREETGRRTLLNYGHTIGHAMESATGYERYRHGEADAIGMTAAAAISRRMGMLSAKAEKRQRALLERFELPVTAEGVDREAVLSAIALDKKVRGSAVRWVLLEDIGRAVVRDDVPEAVVAEALDLVLA